MSHNDNHADSSLNTSMTDLMTSLAIIFILLLIVYLNHSFQEINKGSAGRKERVLKSLLSSNIKAKYDKDDPLSIVFTVSGDELKFDTNKYDLKPEGQAYLRNFIPNLVNSICKKASLNDIESASIVGYTDSDGDDEHNLELSQGRALEVLKFALNKTGLNPENKECLLTLSSTNGRGERDLLPYYSRPGQENKAMSRRVEFKIRVKSYEQIKHMELSGK